MQKLKSTLAFLFSLAMVIGLFANVGLEIEASTNNTVTVYYNNNSWSQANIHYQQANGTWTSVPGEKMTATSEVSGYRWKATINLGSNSSTQVCFNDGNNNWDSQNGANYTVSTGTYGIKDGKQEVINTVTPTPTVSTEKILYFNNYYSKWDNVYAYVWNNNSDAKVFEATIYDKAAKIYEVKITGSYKYIIFKNTKDTWDLQTVDLEIPTDSTNYYRPSETGNKPNGVWAGCYSNRAFQCSLEIGLTSPQIVGTRIPLIGREYDMPGHRYNSYCFVIHKQGTDESKDERIYAVLNSSNEREGGWTPKEPGIYEVSYHAIQYSGYTAVDTKIFVINPN